MLEYLGMPCVQSVGEAEAMCALLNNTGVSSSNLGSGIFGSEGLLKL